MDKLIDKIWWEHSRSTLASDSEIDEMMNKKTFQSAITDYNAERKCCNCKKENKTKAVNSDGKIVVVRYNCNGIIVEGEKLVHCSPFCFTNLFELKEIKNGIN